MPSPTPTLRAAARFWLPIWTLVGFLAGGVPAVADGHDHTPAAPGETAARRQVAILVFEGVELLDFAGPGEAFSAARDAGDQRVFEVFTVGARTTPVVSQRFLSINPQHTFETSPIPDVLVVPGGDVMAVLEEPQLEGFLRKVLAQGGTILTVCNGSTLLARHGLLDGLEVTTHHGNLEILQWVAPAAKVRGDRRVVDSGPIVTAAGVSAGIDGALYLIARELGIEAARDVAVFMEYDPWPALETQVKTALAAPGPPRAIPGRVFADRRDWAVFRLLRTLFHDGREKALAIYPELLAQTEGHDREMISTDGLIETARWLIANGRDPAVGLELLAFVATAHPGSEVASKALAQAQEQAGRPR